MVIHCVHCVKLFYVEDGLAELKCPVCASEATNLATTIVFGEASHDVAPLPAAPKEIPAIRA